MLKCTKNNNEETNKEKTRTAEPKPGHRNTPFVKHPRCGGAVPTHPPPGRKTLFLRMESARARFIRFLLLCPRHTPKLCTPGREEKLLFPFQQAATISSWVLRCSPGKNRLSTFRPQVRRISAP